MPFRWSNIWDIAQCLFLHFMKNHSRKQYWLSGINVFMILLWKILYICLTCLTILAMIWNFWAHILQTEFVTILLFIELFIYFWSSLGCTLTLKYIDTATDSYRYSKRGSGSVYSNAIPGSFFVYIFFVFISSFSSSSSFKIVDASSFRPWI